MAAWAFLCIPGNVTTLVLLGTLEEDNWNGTFEDYEEVQEPDFDRNETEVIHRETCHEMKGENFYFEKLGSSSFRLKLTKLLQDNLSHF